MNPYDLIYDLNDEVNKLTRQLEATKASLSRWESVFGHLGTPDEVGNEWIAMSDRLEAAEKEIAELRSSMKFRTSLIGRTEAERGTVGDQHTCAETKTAYHDAPLYALPGAQPAPSALAEAIIADMQGLQQQRRISHERSNRSKRHLDRSGDLFRVEQGR